MRPTKSQRQKHTQFYTNRYMARTNGDLVLRNTIHAESVKYLCSIVAGFAERVRFAEHRKLVAVSSEFHLTLIERIFFNSKYKPKSGTF